MILTWIKFIACLLIIVFAGRQVARYGDIIAEKTGIGGMWIGLILLSIVTSLPELFTGISAVALVGAPDLTAGNLIGANAFNLFNLALLDIASRNPLVTEASKGHVLPAGLSMVLVACVAAGIFVSSFSDLNIGWIGIYTPIIFLLYMFIMRIIFKRERRQQAIIPQDVALKHEHVSSRKAYLFFAISAVFIIGAGIWLAFIGEEIATITGWGESFVGSLLLAFATTLPEITVSFSALRLGAVDMCIANMIGSNMFNMTIIGIVDLIYTQGPILSAVSQSHIFTASIVLIMTGVFIAGLIFRPQHKTPLRAGWYSLVLIPLFVFGAYTSFTMA